MHLIIGGDNLQSIHDWHKSVQLIANCHLLVAPRLVYRTVPEVTTAGDKKESAFLEAVQEDEIAQKYELPGADVSIIDFPDCVSISSSMVRGPD